MFAQYSPLFTSGLLSDSSPSSSRAPSPQPTRRRRAAHDSLPLTVNSSSFSIYTPHSASEASEHAFYLTFMPSRHQLEQGQSFLSLDLSGDMHRSMSLRRKDTVTTSHGRSVPTSPVMSAPPIPRRFSPSLRRSSRDALPRPKPVPSATLPQVPHKSHRPSNLTLSTSTFFPEVEAEGGPSSSPTASSSRHRTTNSEPSMMTPSLSSPTQFQSYLAFSPVAGTSSAPPFTTMSDLDDEPIAPVELASSPAQVSAVSLKVTPSFRSTATAGTRMRNRSAALAALEGRAAMKRRMSIKRNFMSMSDDEDEEEEDLVEMEKQQLLGVLNEEEDVVIPDVRKASSKENTRESERSSSSSESKRSRRSTFDSLFAPLSNFIDFRDDDNGWRSFVELA